MTARSPEVLIRLCFQVHMFSPDAHRASLKESHSEIIIDQVQLLIYFSGLGVVLTQERTNVFRRDELIGD